MKRHRRSITNATATQIYPESSTKSKLKHRGQIIIGGMRILAVDDGVILFSILFCVVIFHFEFLFCGGKGVVEGRGILGYLNFLFLLTLFGPE